MNSSRPNFHAVNILMLLLILQLQRALNIGFAWQPLLDGRNTWTHLHVNRFHFPERNCVIPAFQHGMKICAVDLTSNSSISLIWFLRFSSMVEKNQKARIAYLTSLPVFIQSNLLSLTERMSSCVWRGDSYENNRKCLKSWSSSPVTMTATAI